MPVDKLKTATVLATPWRPKNTHSALDGRNEVVPA